MATLSGNSTGSDPVQNSGSGGDLQNVRKRKRMQSNRESARRSRQKKQKQLDDLMAQVSQLRKDNGQISSSISVTTHHCVGVEAENSVLRAQMMELTQRLDSLNEILNNINSDGSAAAAAADGCVFGEEIFPQQQGFGYGLLDNDNFWNSVGFNQSNPIMASAHMFDYY